MVKRYAIIVIFLMSILIFTSISVASTVSYKERMSERIKNLQDSSLVKNMWTKLYQYRYNNDNVESDITDDDSDGYDNDVDIEYDEPEDVLKEDVRLPDVYDLVGDKTPDNGDKMTENNQISNTPTIGTNNYAEGTTKTGRIDPNGCIGRVLKRIVEVVGENNEGTYGQLLTRVVDNICVVDSSDVETSNNIVDVVIEGELGGEANAEISNVVVEGGSVGISNAEVSNVEVVTDTN